MAKVPVLIYGDGGEVMLREYRKNAHMEYQPVGFLDDDPLKQDRTVAGLRVLGGAERGLWIKQVRLEFVEEHAR